MIANCGHDENNRYSGGKAGDQTGKEYVIRSWYDRPWTHVLRHPNQKVRELLATLATEAARNENIGYDQGTSGNTQDRYSFWSEVKNVGYRPSAVKRPCETDCSNSTAVLIKCVGYLLGIKELQDVSIYCYTGNLRAALNNAGFKTLVETKYLKSDEHLYEGDVLLCEGHHVTVNLDRGKYSQEYFESKISVGEDGLRLTADVNVRQTPDVLSDNIITVYKAGTQIYPTAKLFVNGEPFFKVDNYYISARYSTGWIFENTRWWLLTKGYTYPSQTVVEYEGKDYAFDRNGWLVEPENIDSLGGFIIT